MSLVPYDYDAAQPTHYDMLDLTPSATVDDVRVAYVRAARQIHPSKAPPELQEEASARFRLVAEAFAVLSNEDRRIAYDHSLGPDTSLAFPPMGSSAFAPPQPSRRPPSPSAFPRRNPALPPQGAHAHDLYNSITHQQQAHSRSAMSSYGLGEQHAEEQNEWRSRIGSKGSLHDMLGEILDEGDPLLQGQAGWGSAPEFGSRGGGWGGGGGGGSMGRGWGESADPWSRPHEAFGADPWGRRFEGEVRPGRMGGRGRTMSASLQEGEKRRNGDYHMRRSRASVIPRDEPADPALVDSVQIKNSKHSVEQSGDGSIKWSTMTLETRYASGQPHPSSGPGPSPSRPRPFPPQPHYPTHARHASHDSPFSPPHPSLLPSSHNALRQLGSLSTPSSHSHIRQIVPALQPSSIEFPPSPAPSTFSNSQLGSIGGGGGRRPSLTNGAGVGRRPSLTGAVEAPRGLLQGAGTPGPAVASGAMVRRSASSGGLRR